MKRAAAFSALLVLPLLILELVNNDENFPLPLFGFLWLLPFLILITLMPMVRQLRSREVFKRNALVVVLKGVFIASLALVCLMNVVDQMPCFLGVPNCD